MEEKVIQLTSRQSYAWRLLNNAYKCSVLYGGGKGGGKSVLFCLWVDEWCQWLIEFFGIKKPLKNPLPVGFVGRKQGIDFRRTTLETFKREIPEDHYRLRNDDTEMIFFDRVKVYCGGLDDKKRINKFNSAEFAFIGVDQAEETERTDVDVLQGALRLKYNGKSPPYKQLYTANPDECWLKEDFIDNPQKGHYFVPALWSDNPHLPEDYADTLTTAFRYNAGLLDAYLNGNWYALQADNALLSAKQLADLKKVNIHFRERRGVIVCDPSLGGDACVINAMVNYKTIEKKVLYLREPMKIAGEMMILGTRHKIPNYAADVTGGLGEAILGRIEEVKPNSNCIFLNYSTREKYFQHGVNLRAEMAWHYMMKVIDQEIPYPEDEQTRKEILAIRFKVADSNGRIRLEKKEDTKKRLGRSPDNADAEIMGVWAIDQTEPLLLKDNWQEEYQSNEISSCVNSAMTA